MKQCGVGVHFIHLHSIQMPWKQPGKQKIKLMGRVHDSTFVGRVGDDRALGMLKLWRANGAPVGAIYRAGRRMASTKVSSEDLSVRSPSRMYGTCAIIWRKHGLLFVLMGMSVQEITKCVSNVEIDSGTKEQYSIIHYGEMCGSKIC